MARLSIIANIITRADKIDMVKAELEKIREHLQYVE